MEDNDVMTLEETSKLLKVHPNTVRRLVKRGELPAKKVGTLWRFSRRAVMEWLEKNGGDSER